MRLKLPFFLLSLLGIVACSPSSESPDEKPKASTSALEGPLFTRIDNSSSGLHFKNEIVEDEVANYFTYEYFYNGGGVAIADFDQDGYQDVFLSGNQVSDQIYRTLPDLKFENKSEGLKDVPTGWSTGVAIADVNGDNLPDIFVCRSGLANDPAQRRNQLLINQGDFVFTEAAEQYGITESAHSNQAAFFDYDLDGDLDLYVMNHPAAFKEKITLADLAKHIAAGTNQSDHLYRNDNGHFKLIQDAGISNHHYGLGLSIADLNADGWPDIYVANDFDGGDLMYINQQDGTFKNEIEQRVKHTSNFGMGIDVADFNNDSHLDIVEMDMAFASHERSKRNMASMSNEKFWSLVKEGQHYQYMSNTLQLNAGNNTFSEVAQLAGIAKTDWSWGPLLADFDNDGWKDLYITNGYKREIKDRDFQAQFQALLAAGDQSIDEIVKSVPTKKIKNYAFRNEGNLTFSNASANWGLDEAVNSNGAAYADLDNDGDLDLIVNNLDQEASVFENHADQTGANFIAIELSQDQINRGAKVTVTCSGQTQMQAFALTRGYQSSVSEVLHFGLGHATTIDKLEVHWPNGKVLELGNQSVNQRLTLSSKDAKRSPTTPARKRPYFVNVTDKLNFKYKHQENNYDDFEKEILLPHRQSRQGPFSAVADVNGDGIDDLFIGGAAGYNAYLLFQQPNGTFRPSNEALWEAEKKYEDMQAVFLDADGNGTQDLYVVSGGNEFPVGSPLLQDRLYLNDGNGNFTLAANALPQFYTSGMSVSAGDLDGDGDLDLVVPGRIVPGHYGQIPQSHLLLNEAGTFTLATSENAPELGNIGMVTRSKLLDLDQDNDLDLIVVGEWIGVETFMNEKGKLTKQNNALTQLKGMWFGLETADFNNDGRPDFILGNLGKNKKFKGTVEKPFNLYASDFDANGSWDIVLSQFEANKNFPVRGRECTSEQMPFIKQKFPTYKAFAEAELETLYTPEMLAQATHHEINEFRSMIVLNLPNDTYQMLPLPNEAQLSPINGMGIMDLNADGHLDLLVAGNLFDAEVETIRYDAGMGLVLLGDGTGNFEPKDAQTSGFYAPGNVKHVQPFRFSTVDKDAYLIFNNQHYMQVYQQL